MIWRVVSCVLLLEAACNAADFTFISIDLAGEGFNDTTPVSPEGGNMGTTLGEQRQNVLERAGEILGQYLISEVPIEVEVDFEALGTSQNNAITLASAGAYSLQANFANAPEPDVLYPQALANSLSGEDSTDFEEIGVIVNSDVDNDSVFSWYYGLDGAVTSGNEVNFLNTILHELCHGLGFSSFVDISDGSFASGFESGVGSMNSIDVFSAQLFDEDLGLRWGDMSAQQRADSVTNTNDLLWGGASTTAAVSGVNPYLNNGFAVNNGVSQVRIYAPNPVESGSSVSHWATSASPNLLMEPSLNRDLDTFGLDLTLTAFRDIGWRVVDIPIPHLTYALWLEYNDLSVSLEASEESSGVLVDSDGDGVSNLEEYFFGSDPNSRGSGLANLPVFAIESGSRTFTYTRSLSFNDLNISYEDNETLSVGAWAPLVNGVDFTEVSTQIDNSSESVTVTLLGAESANFVRIRIVQ